MKFVTFIYITTLLIAVGCHSSNKNKASKEKAEIDSARFSSTYLIDFFETKNYTLDTNISIDISHIGAKHLIKTDLLKFKKSDTSISVFLSEFSDIKSMVLIEGVLLFKKVTDSIAYPKGFSYENGRNIIVFSESENHNETISIFEELNKRK